MRATIRLLLLCLVLGFGIAVAAGWVIGGRRTAGGTIVQTMRVAKWPDRLWTFDAVKLDAWVAVSVWGDTLYGADVNWQQVGDFTFTVIARVEMGFPFRSHMATVIYDTDERVTGFDGRHRPHDSKLWPEAILPVGLVGNAVVYSAALFGLALAVRGALALRRRGRGRCAACGYVLAGLRGGRCPECGGAG